MYTNHKYRGENFTWEWWVNHCAENAGLWMYVHNVRGDKQTINDTAKQYAREIAERLVQRMGE